MSYFKFSRFISFLFIPIFLFKDLPAIAHFSDIKEDNWTYQYVNKLKDKDIVKGFPGNKYKPNEYLTRSQFAVVLTKAFSLKEKQSDKKFIDDGEIPPWAHSYVYAAVNEGLISGDNENKFNPNKEIKRIELINILTLAAKVDLLDLTKVEAVLNIFSDRDKIPPWASRNVASAVAENLIILECNTNHLNPQDNTKRGEAAVLIYLVLEKIGKVKNISIPPGAKIVSSNIKKIRQPNLITRQPNLITIVIIILLLISFQLYILYRYDIYLIEDFIEILLDKKIESKFNLFHSFKSFIILMMILVFLLFISTQDLKRPISLQTKDLEQFIDELW